MIEPADAALQVRLPGPILNRSPFTGGYAVAKRPSLESILAAHQTWVAGQGGSRAVLIGYDLRGADLRAADLRGADLRRADFAGANLEGANLRRANLAESSFVDANLVQALLGEADLSDADLRGADLSGAELANLEVWRANFKGATIAPEDLHLLLNCRRPKK